MAAKRLAIPRSFTFRGQRWRVRAMTPAEKRGAHHGDIGYCDPPKRVILLDASRPRAEQERTFVHELVHAVLPEGFEHEERIARALEAPIRALVLSGALVSTPEEVR